MAKILIIEDETDQIELVKTRLETQGYQVIAARNGEEGVRLATEEKPDLVLLDMILPKMHGLEVAMKLKEAPETEEIPIIALTAIGSPDFIQECFNYGICAYIRKPYEPKELFENIEKHINIDEKGKRIEFDEVEREKEIDEGEYNIEIDLNIDEVLKDLLLEYGMNLEKKAFTFHDKQKKIREG